MANMYPKNLSSYMPTASERIVYQALKSQLPDNYDVFYSVSWNSLENGEIVKSEADFIVVSPEYGYLCLEVKGGTGLSIVDNVWYVEDSVHGRRQLKMSPYAQAEKSMYYFFNTFSNKYNTKYQGIYASGAVFPFYSIDDNVSLDNRNRICTIDCNDLNNIYDCIKRMFKAWAGNSFGRKYYPADQNQAFLELVRERVAVSAAAGALIKYKEQQLDVINRVQDNYVFLLSNVRQFYVKGGAGTGKTWIAMKMAVQEATNINNRVLFLCSSPILAAKIRELILNDNVDVFDLYTLKTKNSNGSLEKTYDAVFVDEAQDFDYATASSVRNVLKNEKESRLGIFYDDVQVLRDDSFGNGFQIDSLPFLLRENIRNTYNIYNWTAQKTKLGTDVIANPVEGPTPISLTIDEKGQLTLQLEMLFKRYLKDENLPNTAIVILTDDVDDFLQQYPEGIAKWKFVHGSTVDDNDISVYSAAEYKGLEADMVIYIHNLQSSQNLNYIAYTRAKYYLIELIRSFQ